MTKDLAFICPFDAIGSAVATFCGQNLGAGKTDQTAWISAAVFSFVAFHVIMTKYSASR